MSYLITVDGEKFENINISNVDELHVGRRVAVSIPGAGQYVVTIESETRTQWRMSDGERYSKLTLWRIRSAKNVDAYDERYIAGMHLTAEQLAKRDAENERHRRLLKSATGHRLVTY